MYIREKLARRKKGDKESPFSKNMLLQVENRFWDF